jgi:hypothetical protein
MGSFTDEALTWPATGSSIASARTARTDAVIIFFMVTDPSRVVTLIIETPLVGAD